jgi:hypothetical protein
LRSLNKRSSVGLALDDRVQRVHPRTQHFSKKEGRVKDSKDAPLSRPYLILIVSSKIIERATQNMLHGKKPLTSCHRVRHVKPCKGTERVVFG